jgi:hypothetical protein
MVVFALKMNEEFYEDANHINENAMAKFFKNKALMVPIREVNFWKIKKCK